MGAGADSCMLMLTETKLLRPPLKQAARRPHVTEQIGSSRQIKRVGPQEGGSWGRGERGMGETEGKTGSEERETGREVWVRERGKKDGKREEGRGRENKG